MAEQLQSTYLQALQIQSSITAYKDKLIQFSKLYLQTPTPFFIDPYFNDNHLPLFNQPQIHSHSQKPNPISLPIHQIQICNQLAKSLPDQLNPLYQNTISQINLTEQPQIPLEQTINPKNDFQPSAKDQTDKQNTLTFPINTINSDQQEEQPYKPQPLPEFNYFRVSQQLQLPQKSVRSQLVIMKTETQFEFPQSDQQDLKIDITLNPMDFSALEKLKKDSIQKQDFSIIFPSPISLVFRQEKQLASVSKKISPMMNTMKLEPLIENTDIKEVEIEKEIQEVEEQEKSRKINKSFKIWDRFSKGTFLGHGKFGDVYSAQDKQTNMVVALKIIKKLTIRKYKIEDLLQEEIKIQSCLNHPNILKLFGVFEEDKSIILVLELGHKNLLELSKGLEDQDICDMSYQIAIAINYMHGQGVIHRDLKPENIMVYNGEIKIADFGLAVYKQQFKRNNQLKLDQYCGTQGYMAPEVTANIGYDQKADVFSLGIIIYELYKREFPKSDDNEIILPDDLKSDVRDLLKQLLILDPKKRISIAQALLHPFFKRRTKKCVFSGLF